MPSPIERMQAQEAAAEKWITSKFNQRLNRILGLRGRAARQAVYLWRLADPNSTWFDARRGGHAICCTVAYEGYELQVVAVIERHREGTDWVVRINDQIVATPTDLLNQLARLQRQIQRELPGND